MISLSHEEFQKSIVKDGGFEVYTQEQFNTWVEDNIEVLQKGEKGTLEDFEEQEYEILKAEMSSFTPIEVINPSTKSQFRIEKSIMYIRPIQVEWDEPELIKGEDGTEIMKARSGRYTNTPMNRKLGRVGQQYGSKKESTEEGDDKGMSEKKEDGSDINKKFESSKTPGSFWNKMTREERVKILKESGIMKDLWHFHTNIRTPGSTDSSGKANYSSNIGIAELNAATESWGDFGKEFKRDFKSFFEDKKNGKIYKPLADRMWRPNREK